MIFNKEALTEQLKRHEGFRAKPYKCTAGKLTIGYGTNLEVLEVSKTTALMLLEEDVNKSYVQLIERFPFVSRLSPARQNVLINMTYNLGLIGVSNFRRMWDALRAKNYDAAANEMLDSKWYIQVGTRATELAQQMREG